MKKIIILVLALSILSSASLAENVWYDESSYTGARPLSMGGAFVGLSDDVNAVFYNPAGLAFSRKTQAQVSAYPMPIDNTNISASYAIMFPALKGQMGISQQQNDTIVTTVPGDEFTKSQIVGLSYGYRVNNDLAFGIRARQMNYMMYMRPTIDISSAHGSSLDLGYMYKFGKKLTFGVMANAVNSTHVESVDYAAAGIARTIQAGICYAFSDKLRMTLDTQKNVGIDKMNWTNQYGIEFDIARSYTLRGGLYNYNNNARDSVSSFGTTIWIVNSLMLDIQRVNLNGKLTDNYSVRINF